LVAPHQIGLPGRYFLPHAYVRCGLMWRCTCRKGVAREGWRRCWRDK